MPAAASKDDLLRTCRTEYGKLAALIDGIDPATALRPCDGATSIRDVVAHRAHWIDLFLGWQADGAAGRAVHMPAEGVRWSDLKSYNAALREAHAGLSWDAAVARIADAHERLMARLEALDDDALYGGPMPGGNGKWTTGRYAEAAGSSHYRSAAKFVRACLRAAAQE